MKKVKKFQDLNELNKTTVKYEDVPSGESLELGNVFLFEVNIKH